MTFKGAISARPTLPVVETWCKAYIAELSRELGPDGKKKILDDTKRLSEGLAPNAKRFYDSLLAF